MLGRYVTMAFFLWGFLGAFVYGETLLEMRGVWIDVRSIPHTEAGIESLVERLYQAHCNALFVESFYRGETIYPSSFLARWGLPSQMESFRSVGLDPLSIFIREARKRDMQVHAWLDMFYVGLDVPGPLLSVFPQWVARNRDGTAGYVQGGKRFFFVCPRHEGVLEFYKGFLGELVERYNLDGIHLDYFRFPDPTLADSCYCEGCRRAFRKETGIDPLYLDPVGDFEAYRKWVLFRTEELTDFAAALLQHIRTIQPGVLLSCAVKPFGFPLEGYPGFLQDWPKWGKMGLFDFLVPMTYSSRPLEFEGLLVWVRTFLRGIPFCAGVWCAGASKETIIDEIVRARKHTPCGVVLFAYPYLSDDLLIALPHEVFQERTWPPSFRDFLLLASPSLSPQEFLENRRTMVAQEVRMPIVVDGVLEDVWKEADWQGNFAHLVEGRPKRNTQVAVLYDEENLYVAYVLEGEPTGAKVTQHDGPVFYENSVELFLDPWLSRSHFFQFAANFLGTQYEGSSFRGVSWDGTWKVGVTRRERKTFVEMAIPFVTLARDKPQRGETWGINFCHNDIENGEFSTWTRMPGIYGASFFFGTLRFQP